MTYITLKLTTFILLLGSLLSTYQCSVTENNPNDVRNLLTKINSLLDSQSCSSQSDRAFRPCFDMTSSQSVLQQLCDKIAALELKVDSLASNGIKNPSSNLQQDKTQPYNISVDEVSKMKKEIESLKRWSVFSAEKLEKVAANTTREPIKNYNTTMNDGTGVGFDSTNGVYMAHYDGVYHFILKYPKPPPEVKLEISLVNDNIILAKSSDEQCTQIDVMTSLKTGQQVWADFTSHNTPENYQVLFKFSGSLLN